MKRKDISIGLFGFGCVGYGLYEVLQRTPGLKATIKGICVKDKTRQRPISADHFTYDKNDLLNDESINTIVELIDDADAAYEIVKAALQKGKAVVTANKKLLAEHLEELLLLQEKHGAPLLYEAACCASIPIIRNLEEYYDNDLLESIEGIVNGSTNYILTQTSKAGISYEEALKEAQQKGYAESNPLLDTGGFDAKYKLQILLAHAFGILTTPDELCHVGIDRLGELELNYAHEKGYKIKLIASAEKTGDGKIRAFVLPKFIPPSDKLFSVDDVFNGIKTKTHFSDVQFFSGKGAGAYPTASAVLSDISALSYDYRYEYKKLNPIETLAYDSDVFLKVFLRHPFSGDEYREYFEEIQEAYLNHTSGFIIGILSLENLKKIVQPGSKTSVVLFESAGYERKYPYREKKSAYAFST